MAHYFVYRQVKHIEADSLEEAMKALDRWLLCSVSGNGMAWYTDTPNAADRKRGEFYPGVIVMERSHLPWNTHPTTPKYAGPKP